MVRWSCGNFQCRGVLQFGYSRARAYCACSRCGWVLFGHFYSPLYFLFSFSLSFGDGPIWTEILSQRAVKPKTTSQLTFFVEFQITRDNLSIIYKAVADPSVPVSIKLIYLAANPTFTDLEKPFYSLIWRLKPQIRKEDFNFTESSDELASWLT